MRWVRRTVTRTSRRLRLATTGLAALLGLGGCGANAAAEPPDVASTGAPPPVSFTATLAVHDQAVHITYRLVNTGSRDLIVLNGVPAHEETGQPRPDRNAVYITGAGRGRVVIAKRAFAMPDTTKKTWYAAPRIAATPIAPGATIAEEITVPMPLRRRHPYGDDIGEGPITLPNPIKDIVFCLGVARPSDVTIDPDSPAAQPILPHLAGTTRGQHLFCSEPVKP